MFEEAMKLYLKYPAEMEYWYWKKDEEEIDATLVSEIAEDEGDAFLDTLSEAYELALEQFKDGIADPLGKALSQAANAEGLELSRPNKRAAIAGEDWWWNVHPKNGKGGGFHKQIGCFSVIEKSGDVSVLNAYPWILTRGGGREATRLAEQLGDGWCITDGWDIGAINREVPISIRPEREPKAVVDSIRDCLVPHMGLLAREVLAR